MAWYPGRSRGGVLWSPMKHSWQGPGLGNTSSRPFSLSSVYLEEMLIASPNMILPAHPDRPDKLGLKHLGYWRPASLDPTAPPSLLDDFERDLYEKNKHLPTPQDFVDEAWDPTLRARVVAYLKVGKSVQQWRGHSYCRFRCDGRDYMGSKDFSDGTYVWPEGFWHYVAKHGVKPPDEFIRHIFIVCKVPGCPHDPHHTRWEDCPPFYLVRSKTT